MVSFLTIALVSAAPTAAVGAVFYIIQLVQQRERE